MEEEYAKEFFSESFPVQGEELSFDEQEERHQQKLSELARNSPFFVNCDEDVFELNDDGSARVHLKQESPAVQEDTFTEVEDEEGF